jgi:exodeoxyribonuclease VII large subunit
MVEKKIWTVSEVNNAVREVIEGGFHPFWIHAEIGTLNVHRSGHVYLTLKDSGNQLKGVFFRGANQIRENNIAVGTQIEAFGSLTVYQVRGEYQFSIQSLRPLGKGNLQQQFEDLKKKLASEGLFEQHLKKPLPLLPSVIGVVTSPGGAALRDFLNIIHRRFPNIKIRIYPAPVQGNGAGSMIAEGVNFFNQYNAADVIVVTRGGGSMEDLWAFNEEILARTIAGSKIPVISAVGHEIDFTIADFVADLRVPTPSAAAELVVGRREEFYNFLETAKRRMNSSLELLMERSFRRLDAASNSRVFQEPVFLMRQHQQRVDELESRLNYIVSDICEKQSVKLRYLQSGLSNLNPKSVLNRGYSILLDSESGEVIDENVSSGRKLKGILSKGEIHLTVD